MSESEGKKVEEEAEKKTVEEEQISDDEPETLDEDDPDMLPEDSPPFPENGPSGEVELSDEQMDKQGSLKQQATDALEDGNLNEAVEKYTAAIMIGNASAMMYAKRAEMLLKLKKPCAAIASADAAIEVNPDSAKSLRARGKAHRLLGHWEKAHLDLSTAQKLDFDDATDDLHKFVGERYKKIALIKNRNRMRAEKRKVAEMKRKRAEAVRIYEEQKKAEAEGGGFPGGFPAGMEGMFGPGGMPAGMEGMFGGMGGMPGGMGGMPGGMPGMPAGMDPNLLQGLMSDPELLAALSDPKMMAAMQDIMSNPANMSKYQSDPEMMGLMQKLMSKMGGGAAGGHAGDSGPGTSGGAAGGTSSGPTIEEIDEVD
jgi:suppressor of tumorigenicity protein 13